MADRTTEARAYGAHNTTPPLSKLPAYAGVSALWTQPAQGHRSVSVSRHFLLQTPQCPCSVWKRFSRDHCCRGRSKPGCRIVGSHTRWELTTWADFQLFLHRLLMSTGCKSSHNGFLDVSRSNGGLIISGWIGQLSCLTNWYYNDPI